MIAKGNFVRGVGFVVRLYVTNRRIASKTEAIRNGKPVKAVIDTGSFLSFLPPELIDELKLPQTGQVGMSGIDGIERDTPVFEANMVFANKLNNNILQTIVPIFGVPPTVFPGENEPRSDAGIGRNFLTAMKVELSMATGVKIKSL